MYIILTCVSCVGQLAIQRELMLHEELTIKAGKKRSSKADATVEKILTASLARIIAFGESGISMTEICREVGISRPTIYRYFPTREALLESVFEYILDDYMDKLDAKIAANPDPLHRVDIIADFAEARLKDGGAQLFQLEPSLVMKLISRSQNRLIGHAEKVFAPLFDIAEAISGKPVDRHSAATAFLMFSASLSFFGAQSSSVNAGDLLRKTIRSLAHFS